MHYDWQLWERLMMINNKRSDDDGHILDYNRVRLCRTGISIGNPPKIWWTICHLDYERRLKIVGLWLLEERRNRAAILEVYKMYSGVSAQPFGDMFEISGNTQTRGHILKLAKHRCRLAMRKFFFSKRVIDRWNSLDQKIIDQQTINNFKNCFSRWKNIKKGFFMDPWSSKPQGLIRPTEGASPSTVERVWPHPVSYPVSYVLAVFGTFQWSLLNKWKL